MSIAKAFYQCHILRFLSSHLVQLPYHRSLSYSSFMKGADIYATCYLES